MKKKSINGSLAVVACMAALSFTACNKRAETEHAVTNRAETKKEATTTESKTTAAETGRFGGRAAGTESTKSMMPLMEEHMQKMRGIKMTGDPDYDFAQMMKMHHEGANRMSEEEIGNGQDSTLKRMANRIITTNNSEIKQLQTYMDSNKPAKGDTATTMRMMQPMRKMMAGMSGQGMEMGMGKGTDENYARMMIQHDQSGIGMAEELLKQGKSREMKTVAQNMIDEQKKEVKELEGWLSKNRKP